MALGSDGSAQFWVVLVGPLYFNAQPLARFCRALPWASAPQHLINTLNAGLEGIVSKSAGGTRLGRAAGFPKHR